MHTQEFLSRWRTECPHNIQVENFYDFLEDFCGTYHLVLWPLDGIGQGIAVDDGAILFCYDANGHGTVETVIAGKPIEDEKEWPDGVESQSVGRWPSAY
jgi:hypothetical protein